MSAPAANRSLTISIQSESTASCSGLYNINNRKVTARTQPFITIPVASLEDMDCCSFFTAYWQIHV